MQNKKAKRDHLSMEDISISLPNGLSDTEIINNKLDDLVKRVINLEKILDEFNRKFDLLLGRGVNEISYIS